MSELYRHCKRFSSFSSAEGALRGSQMGVSRHGALWMFSDEPIQTIWAVQPPPSFEAVRKLLRDLPRAEKDLFLIVLGEPGNLLAVVFDKKERLIRRLATLQRRQDGWVLGRGTQRNDRMEITENSVSLAPDAEVSKALRVLLASLQGGPRKTRARRRR